MKKLKLTLLILFLFLFMTSVSDASIRITPDRFDLEAKSNTKFINGSFTIQAGADETIRFKVYPEYFDISDNGKVITSSGEDKKNSFVNNLHFVPAEFTLTDGKTQKIRFTVVNVDSLPDGESRAILFMEDVKTKEQALPTGNPAVSANLTIKSRIGIPIYIDKGKFIKTGSLEKINVEKLKNKYVFNLNIKSSGNSKIRTEGFARILKGKELISEFPINEHPIESNTLGKITEVIPDEKLDPDNEYNLKIKLYYTDQNHKKQELTQDCVFKTTTINHENKI